MTVDQSYAELEELYKDPGGRHRWPSSTTPSTRGQPSEPFHAVETLDSQAWPAALCPLCADGVPLAGP